MKQVDLENTYKVVEGGGVVLSSVSHANQNIQEDFMHRTRCQHGCQPRCILFGKRKRMGHVQDKKMSS